MRRILIDKASCSAARGRGGPTRWTPGPGATPCRQVTILSGVAYGDGLFVAVGDVGTIITSADGTNWVLRQSGTTDGLSDVAYGNGEFVAVGSVQLPNCYECLESITVTSSDGISWVSSAAILPEEFVFDRITFGNGHFVASGGDPEGPPLPILLTPTDGVKWFYSGRVDGTPLWLGSKVGFGNGQFVAVGNSSIGTSFDGTNWVQRLSAVTNGLSSIAYGNGQFVAVGVGAVFVSTNGNYWVQRISDTPIDLSDIAYGSGQFDRLWQWPVCGSGPQCLFIGWTWHYCDFRRRSQLGPALGGPGLPFYPYCVR